MPPGPAPPSAKRRLRSLRPGLGKAWPGLGLTRPPPFFHLYRILRPRPRSTSTPPPSSAHPPLPIPTPSPPLFAVSRRGGMASTRYQLDAARTPGLRRRYRAQPSQRRSRSSPFPVTLRTFSGPYISKWRGNPPALAPAVTLPPGPALAPVLPVSLFLSRVPFQPRIYKSLNLHRT